MKAICLADTEPEQPVAHNNSAFGCFRLEQAILTVEKKRAKGMGRCHKLCHFLLVHATVLSVLCATLVVVARCAVSNVGPASVAANGAV